MMKKSRYGKHSFLTFGYMRSEKMTSIRKRCGISRFKDQKAEKEFVRAYKDVFASFPRPTTIYDVKTSFGTVRVYYYVNELSKMNVPLLLLHGRYTSSLMWKENLPAFMEKYPVYMIDIIGEPGLSVQTRPFVKSLDQAVWLEEMLVKLNLEKISLIGASMGGWAAVNYIRYFPGRVKSLTLLDPVFVFTPISLTTVRQFLLFPLTKEKMLPFLLNEKKVPLVDAMGRTVKIGMWKFLYRSPIPFRIKIRELKEIRCPVLTIMAGRSPLHDSEKAVALGRKVVRRIEIENWKHASHALTFELSDAVNRRILAFLEKNG